MRGLGQIAAAVRDRAAGHRRHHGSRARPSRAGRLRRGRRPREGGAGRPRCRRTESPSSRSPLRSTHICATTSRSAASARSTSSCATTARTCSSPGERIRFPVTSRHQAQNALTALTAYDALGLPLERLAEAAATVSLSPLARGGARASRRRLRRQRRVQREPDLDGGGAAPSRRARLGPEAAGDPRRDGRARRARGAASPRDRRPRRRARDRGARSRGAGARLRRARLGARCGVGARRPPASASVPATRCS